MLIKHKFVTGTNPGLGFRPISEKTEQGSLIWYKGSDKGSIDSWVKLVDEFLQRNYF